MNDLRKALAHEAMDRMVAENQRLGLYDDGPTVKTPEVTPEVTPDVDETTEASTMEVLCNGQG
jgi:hypothetical protein